MTNLKLRIAALLVVVATAACGPAAESISSAQATQPAPSVPLYPQLAEDAGDGHVHEYY